MAKRKKRGTALPRVTLLAYSRRDLVEFTAAVESFRHLVNDLRLIIDQMPKPRKRNRPLLVGVTSPVGEGPTLFEK